MIPLFYFILLSFFGRQNGSEMEGNRGNREMEMEMDSDEGNKATMTATKAEAIKHTRGHKNK